MALNDVLLHIDSYPKATPALAIDQAVDFVSALGGRLSALAVKVTIPLRTNRIADYLIGLSDMVREEEGRSRSDSEGGLAYFRKKAQAAAVLGDVLLESANVYLLADHVARRARTRDLCIVPLAGPYDGQIEVVESVIFDSGRPALVFRAGEANLPPARPARVVIAWDGGRWAARAMAEALPILKLSQEIQVLTVLNEKPSAVAGLSEDAVRHLKAHGLTATGVEIDAKGRPVGEMLDDYLAQLQPDLLVMGAYGHSRLREFVLGGATEHVLRRPKAPLFLSH